MSLEIRDPNSGRSQNANYWRQVNAPPAAPVAGAQEAGTTKDDGLDRARALYARAAAYPDLIKRAREALNRACRGKLHMCSPMQDDDDDVILSTVINALESARATVAAQAEEIGALKVQLLEQRGEQIAQLEEDVRALEERLDRVHEI